MKEIPWHLREGNKEIQLQIVFDALNGKFTGKFEEISMGTVGFEVDKRSANEFVTLINQKLASMQLEGVHDLHQSSTGSGKWYYKLKAVYPLNHKDKLNFFQTFKEASSFAKKHGGRIQRFGSTFKVELK